MSERRTLRVHVNESKAIRFLSGKTGYLGCYFELGELVSGLV